MIKENKWVAFFFQKEDDLVERSLRESNDSSPFNKAECIQIVSNFTYMEGAIIDDSNNLTRVSLMLFVMLRLAALRKVALEVMRMDKDEEKSESSLPINVNKQSLRVIDFCRPDIDDCWSKMFTKFKERCESVTKIYSDGFYDSSILLQNQDIGKTYSKCMKKLIMSLEYVWYVFEY